MKKLLIALVLVVSPVAAATRYAGPSGSGSTCSLASPCTPATCVSGMADNDTCILLNGTYTNPATIATGRSCTTRCYVQAETTGSVIINKTSGDAVSLSSGENNWTIQGLVVNNAGSGKGYVASGVSGLRLTDNSYFPTYNVITGEGIYAQGGSDIIVTNYTARHDTVCNNQTTAPCTGSGGPDDCDFWNDGGALFNIGGGYTDVIVQDSHMGYFRNTGRLGNITNLTLRRNTFSNCVNHGCAEIDDSVNVLVENNIMNMDRSGACSDSYNGGDFLDTYCWKDVTIRNNTLVAHGTGPNTFIYHFRSPRSECNDGVGPENMDPAGSAQYMNEKVYNNIIYHGGTSGSPSKASPFIACLGNQDDNFDQSPTGQYQENYNILASCGSDRVGYANDNNGPLTWAQWRAWNFNGVAAEANGTNSAPTFVSYTNGGLFGANDNLRLALGSVGINAGVSTGTVGTNDFTQGLYPCPATDFDGNPRNDGQCDIGAFEYQTSTPLTSPRTPTTGGTLGSGVIR